MSFLDNLESNLKNLESSTEREPMQNKQRAEAERASARAAAPYADELKRGQFTNDLLTHAVRIGHGMRTKIHMNWAGNVLVLKARERKLELRPTPDGVVAVFFEDGVEQQTERVDLKGSGQELAERWLS